MMLTKVLTLYRAEESRTTSMNPNAQKKMAATIAGRRQTTTMMIATRIVVMNMIAVNVTPTAQLGLSWCLKNPCSELQSV